MHFELQVDAKRVLALLRNRARRASLCFINTIPITVAGQTESYVVDRVEVLDGSRLERRPNDNIVVYGTVQISGADIFVVQPVRLFLAKVGDLVAANDKPLPIGPMHYLQATYEVVFEVRLVEGKDGVDFRVDLRDVVATGSTPPLDEATKAMILAGLKSLNRAAPVDLTDMEEAFPFTFEIAHVAVGTNLAMTLIALRFEIHSPALDGFGPWQTFFQGLMPDRLLVSWTENVDPTKDVFGHPIDLPDDEDIVHTLQGDWSTFIDKQLIIPVVRQKVEDGLAGQNKLAVTSGIGAEWDPSGHLPRVGLTFSGEVLDVGFAEQDVAVDVTVKALIEAAGQNQLRIAAGFTYDTNDWDEFWVLALNVQLAGLAGGIVGGAIGGWIGSAIGAVVAGLGASIALVEVVHDPPFDLPPLPDCVNASETQVVCTQPSGLPTNPLLGAMTLQRVTALDQGPLLMGAMEQPLEASVVQIDTVELHGFTWRWRDVCGDDPALVVGCLIRLTAKGNVPLRLCRDPGVRADPLGQFVNHVTTTQLAGAATSEVALTIEIPEENVLASYLNPPAGASHDASYPLQLFIQTTGGARIVTLPGFPGLTDADRLELQQKFVVLKFGCRRWAESSFWSDLGRIPPQWLIDPPSEHVASAHLWQVGVRGLAPGESFSLEDREGRTLGTAAPDAGGVARLNALVTSPTGDGEITIVRNAAGEQVHAGPAAAGRALARLAPGPQRLMVQQTMLSRAAALGFAHPCSSVFAGHFDGTPVVFCITSGGTHYLYDLSIPHVPSLRRRVLVPGLRGVIPWRDGFLLWGEGGLRLLSFDARCPKPSPSAHRNRMTRPVQEVTVTRDRVFATVDGRREVYDHALKRVRDVPLPECVSPPGRSGRNAPYARHPWFEGTARVRRTVARIDRGGRIVEIWTVGLSQRIG